MAAYKHKKPSDLKDLKKFAEVYNNPTLTNQQVMDKLDAEWSAIKIKVTSNSTLSATLTLSRTGGPNGQVLRDGVVIDPATQTAPAAVEKPKKPSGKTSDKKSADKAETTAAKTETTAEQAFTTEEPKQVDFIINYRIAGTSGPTKTVTGKNQLDAEQKLDAAIAGERINKYAIYLNGNQTDTTSIPNGATVEVRKINKAGAEVV